MSLSPFRSPISVILAIAVLDQPSQSLADGVCIMCDRRGGSTPQPHKLQIFFRRTRKGYQWLHRKPWLRSQIQSWLGYASVKKGRRQSLLKLKVKIICASIFTVFYLVSHLLLDGPIVVVNCAWCSGYYLLNLVVGQIGVFVYCAGVSLLLAYC